MAWQVRLACGLAACALWGQNVLADPPGLVGSITLPTGPSSPEDQADEPAAGEKARVELRWVETRVIEGLTESEGFQSSCDPDDMVYPHKEPALVLTAAEVAGVRMTNLDLSKNGLSAANYMVDIELTQEARDHLAAQCQNKEMRLITVIVDGRHWGVMRYEIDRDAKFVPESCRAESFSPYVGFFPAKAHAERLVAALQ